MRSGLPYLATLLVLVSALGAVCTPANAGQATAQTSAAAGKPLLAARDAIEAKKYDEALARLKQVQALSGKTPFDEFLMNEMLGFVYAKTKRYSEAVQPLAAGLDSGFLKPQDVPQRVRELMSFNYELKQYDQVIELGSRAIKDGYADEETYTVTANSYYLRGDYQKAVRFLESYVDGQIKKGNKPKEQLLKWIDTACLKVDDSCRERALERLVKFYPKPEYWQTLVYYVYRGQAHETDEIIVQVYRLAAAVDALRTEHDYEEYAHFAFDAGSPGEAQSILQQGFQRKVFDDPRAVRNNQKLLNLATTQAADDRAALPKMEAEAAAAKSGEKDVKVGLAYLGYQQYDKATTALRRGLSKPGVRNEPNAYLLLGIAELNAGHRDEARKAFRSVKGNPTLERLATLWTLHAES